MVEQSLPTDEMFFARERQLSAIPQQQRLAIVEGWKLNAARDSGLFSVITRKVTEIGNLPGSEAQKLRAQRRDVFERKLDHLVGKLVPHATEYPCIGEDMFNIDEFNEGLHAQEAQSLMLPSTVSPDELRNMARLRYVFESELYDNIVVGYVNEVQNLWRQGAIPQGKLFCVLRDGRVFYAAAKGLAEDDESRKIQPTTINQGFINRAVAAALAERREDVDYASELRISPDEALEYIEQLGIIARNTVPLTIFLDTGSIGSTVKAIKEGIKNRGKVTAIYLTAENPYIPAYVPYLESNSWFFDKNNPRQGVMQNIVRDYAEDHVGSFCYRPEEFTRKSKRGRLVFSTKLPNIATSILSWTSLQAARDTGAVHGRMEQVNDPIAKDLPRISLEFLYDWWKGSVLDAFVPNIAFTHWPIWDKKDDLIGNWPPDILEDLGLS